MRSTIPMRTAKTGYIVMSLLLCVFGLLLVFLPGLSLRVLGIICGILIIVFGVFKLVGYFSRDLYRLAFQYDLAFGGLLILLGIAMLIRPAAIVSFFCAAIGVAVLIDGLLKVQMAIDAKKFGLRRWWLILATAVITIVFGFLLVFRPSESSSVITILLGLSLLSEGLMNLSTALTAVKIVKNQQPDVIEGDFEEK